MQDRFGNPLHEGDRVIYFSSCYSKTVHIGQVVEAVEGKGIKLLSDKGNPIHRGAHTLILYTGNVP